MRGVTLLVAGAVIGAATGSVACPAASRVACILCHDTIEAFNAAGTVPVSLDDHCTESIPKWRATYETLTGSAPRPASNTRSNTAFNLMRIVASFEAPTVCRRNIQRAD